MPMNFKQLCEANQDPAKVKDQYIFTMDPGETSGFSVFYNNSLVDFGHVTTVKDDEIQWLSLVNFLAQRNFPINHMICENYRIYQHKLQQHAFSPVLTLRLIGGIELYCAMNQIPITYQMASQAKGFVTDEKLMMWDMYKPGYKHARDAIRHGCYYLLFGCK